ncbi:MAG TPA: carboxypeptidase regulatory-like domain-containing protein [Acidobacteriaceae bacterium]|jgi:hypothetical protein
MIVSTLRKAAIGAAIAAALCFTLPSAHAVDVNGRIKGTVTDPQSAVLPGVTVTAINEKTGVKYTTKTAADGSYFFPQLPIGTYDVSVQTQGFQAFLAKGIVLNIDQEYVETVKLEVGSENTTLEVSASAVQVNTTDMQLNNIVNSEQMVELPLIGRGFTGLELIEPGVQSSSDRFGSSSVSGAQSQQSEFLVNGADTNDIALNTLAFSPNLDAIDQFNLIDGPLNAEYDRNSGGIVSATIKQGTNHIHGDAFEFYRDTFLNTNNFFQKAYTNGVRTDKVSKFHQNIFGGTVGGPVLKDKLFFFGAYQGTRQGVPQGGGSVSVYNANELAGNFTIDNPATQGARPALPTPTTCPTWGSYSCNFIPATITVPGCTSTTETWAQCAYDLGGTFPTSTFNTISKNLISKYVPAPNNGTNGYAFQPTVTTSTDQYIGRGDFALNSRNQITGLFILHRSAAVETLPFSGGTLPGFGDQNVTRIGQYTGDYVHQFSATLVNDLAVHYTRFNFQAVLPQNVVTPSSLGFNINPQDAAAASVPTISVAGTNVNFTLGFSTNGPQPRIDQVYQLNDSVSKTFGAHNLKFGYDGRRFNVSNPFFANNSGNFGFNATTAGTYSTGDGGLDFLLGLPSGYSQGSGAVIQADAFLNYLFAQDSWRLTNSFTLNYGIGYSIDTPLRNHAYGGLGIACLVPGQQSKIFPNAPIGIGYPGDNGCTISGQAYTRYTEAGPRVGFAWAPNLGKFSAGDSKKFSIRGGFGIYYDRSEEETSLQTLETPPFGISSNGVRDYNGGVPTFADPYKDITTGALACGSGCGNKFPYIPPTAGQASKDTFAAGEPLDISTYGSGFRAPYAENFQLSVEREFPSRVVARVSYVGSLARHNQITYDGNPETAAGHAACLAGNENSVVAGGTINCTTNRANQQYFFPQNFQYASTYDSNSGTPGYTSIGTVGSEGASSYHALQAEVNKAPSHGLSFQLSYTYSHALDNGSSFENSGFGGSVRGYNQFQQSLNYGDSNFDARQRLVFAPIYQVPFKHGGSAFSIYNLALAGWQVSGITTLATGFPFDISYGGSSSSSLWCSSNWSFYACPDVPNQVAPLVRANPRVRIATAGNRGQYFLKTSFAAEAIGTFGNEHRNPYHGPGINNTNMILAKNFNLGADGVRRLQLRMESDNVFNHTQLSNPASAWADTVPNSSTTSFGQISSAAAARQTQLAAKFYF